MRRQFSLIMVLILLFNIWGGMALAAAELTISMGSPKAGSSLKISWPSIDNAEHYEYSVKDLTSNTQLYNRKSTSKTYFSISSGDMIAGHSYRVWVGAIVDGNYGVKGEHQDTKEFSVPACSHSDREKFIYEDTYRCESNDEDTHNIWYIYDYRCADCGEQLTWNWSKYEEDEKHSFKSNGICRDCGYEEDCSHSNTKEIVYGQKGTGTSISNTQHKITWLVHVVCNGCGENVKDTTKTETLNHQFDSNGDCKVCDYRAGCSHSSKKTKVEKTYYSVKDATYHYYIEQGHIVCANANCGKEIEPYYEEEKEKHNFSGNTCTGCGYVKAEALTVSVSRGQSSATVGQSISASATVKGGSGSYNCAWEVYCDDVQITKTDYSYPLQFNYVTTKAGDWKFKVYIKDNNTGEEKTATTGAIAVAKPACTHASTKKETVNTEKIKISDTKHEVRTYYNKVCTSCQKVVSSGSYDTTTESHSVDASGKCACGYVKPTVCQHTNSTPQKINSYLEKYDQNRHRVITVYKDICANSQCGVVLNAKREEAKYENHSYDSNGKCQCGYVAVSQEDPCDHAPEETVGKPQYSVKDDTYHKISRVYTYRCECGKVNYSETKTSTDKHSFTGNVCRHCGYEKKEVCTHQPVQTLIDEAKPVQANEVEHLVVRTYQEKCTCGQINRTVTKEVLLPHERNGAAMSYQLEHENGLGHRLFYKCVCGAHPLSGGNTPSADDYYEYVEELGRTSKCAVCRVEYEKRQELKELQKILNNKGYNAGKEDGLWGQKTKDAMNSFRKKEMGLDAIESFDEATKNALYEYQRLIKQVQEILNSKGYNAGTEDGLWGTKTRDAMNSFRKKEMGLGAIDKLDETTKNALLNGICQHNGKYTNERTEKSSDYINENDPYWHTVYASSQVLKNCADCGAEVKGAYNSSFEGEAHDFNEDAICKKCGYESTRGVYSVLDRFEMYVETQYYSSDESWIYININEPVTIMVYDQFEDEYRRAFHADVKLSLNDPYQIAQLNGDVLTAKGSGQFSIDLYYLGKKVDTLKVGVTNLSVQDDWDDYQIESSVVVKFDDVNDVNWYECNVLLTPNTAIGDYRAIELTNGNYQISFNAYNSSSVVVGVGAFHEDGSLFGKVKMIEPFWDTSGVIEGGKQVLGATLRQFDKKSFNGVGTQETHITLTVPAGGYIKFLQMNEDSSVYAANMAEMFLGSIKIYNDAESLNPTNTELVETLVEKLGKDEFYEVFRNYLIRTYGTQFDDLAIALAEKAGDEVDIEYILETMMSNGDDIVAAMMENLPEAVLDTIVDEGEDVALFAMGPYLYYIKHGIQFYYDSNGIYQLMEAYNTHMNNGKNVKYVDSIIMPQESLSDHAIQSDILRSEGIISYDEPGQPVRTHCTIGVAEKVDMWYVNPYVDYGAGERLPQTTWYSRKQFFIEETILVVSKEFEALTTGGDYITLVSLHDHSGHTYTMSRKDFLKYAAD